MLFVFAAMGLCVALLALAERRWAAVPGAIDRSENLKAFGLHLAGQFALLPLVTLAPITDDLALVDLASWPLPLAVLAFVVAMDFGEFVFHRAQHAVPWLWRMHALHHSDPNMNATTALRHFWGDQLLKAVTVWALCGLLLKPTATIVLCYAVISLWHLFVHANLKVDLGRWSWLINHPAYHRRHHSAEPAHFGSNFAGLFPIFDVIFGSYRRPDGHPRTGLDKRPRGLADLALWPLRYR